MLARLLTCLLLCVTFKFAEAQCTIQAKRLVCVNDLVSFSITNSSGTISSWSWNFGAYGTSTNTSPTIQFTSGSTLVVSCTLTLAGGGQCIDTHTIVIKSGPTAKTTLDKSVSDSCNLTNKMCIKNLFKKGGSGFYSLNILWGDGTLSTYGSPLASSWCYTYPDTGIYDIDVILKDSAGCTATTKMTVHIVPSVVSSALDTVTFACDSSKICFKGTASGGNKLTSGWYADKSSTKFASGLSFCRQVHHGDSFITKFITVNEYGCRDTFRIGDLAQDSVLSNFHLPGHRYCMQQLKMQELGMEWKFPINWIYNGKDYGKGPKFQILTGKAGWNYLKVKAGAPCPGTAIDSFFLVVPVANGIAYNEVQLRGANDTVWFVDISKNPPGSRISRLWRFDDDSAACQDTTWTLKGQHVNQNCNYSKDSIAWHFYNGKKCPVAVQLTLFDSSTGCTVDTFIDVYDKEICMPFTNKASICIGESVNFDINVGLYKKIRKKNYILTDIVKPRDSVHFDGTSLQYFYTTVGHKSPIFWRYYPADTVWTEKNGKMVIDFIRPAVGWVVDTFKNLVEVKYKPRADFTITKLGNCNPSKIRIDFKDSFWLYPQEFKVNWGDDSIYDYTGFKDTIAKLTSLEHTYKKTGYYGVVAFLIPKNGCTSNYVEDIHFGYDVRFGFKVPCNSNTVCMLDTVFEYGTKNYWTKAGGQGQLYWSFGDSTYDSGFNMCHNYAKPGTYKVKLSVLSKQGCEDTFVKILKFGQAEAAIKPVPLVYCSELKKYFDSSYSLGVKDSAKIIKWRWDFNDGSNPVFVQNPVHIFPGGGTYNIRLIITTNRGCKDTAYKPVTVYGPNVKAAIISDSAGCIPLTVKFANLSVKTGNFIWEFGDSNNTFYSTKKDTNVWFKYTKPGVYYAHLVGGDSFYNPNTGNTYFCTITYPDSGQNQLRIVVTPGYHAEFTGPDTVCTYDFVEFKNNSDTTYAKKFLWDMGNGDTLIRPPRPFKYKFPSPGNFTVALQAYVPGIGNVPCHDTARQKITVLNFTPDFSSACGSAKGTVFEFKNLSGPDLYNYQWMEFSPSDSSYKTLMFSKDLSYDFGIDTGNRIICLRLDTGKYCALTTCKTIHFASGIFLANVFTPGEKDGFNDVFRIPLHGYEDYELRIFNRWGERVFYSRDAFFEWNGKVMNTGPEAPAGTYFYQLKYRDQCGDRKIKMITGSVNLIR